jgi:hypothetical protein
MIELIILSVGAFLFGYLTSYIVMTFGIKQDKE